MRIPSNPFLEELSLPELLDTLGASCDDDCEDASLGLDRSEIAELLSGFSVGEDDYRGACVFEMVKRSRAAGFGTRLSQWVISLNLGSKQ